MIAQALARIATVVRPSGSECRSDSRAFAIGASSSDEKGSGAPSHRPALGAFPVLAAVIAVLVLFALAAVPALASAAVSSRPAEGNFGSAAEPTFTAPAAMAVDQTTGDVYVVDSETKTLYRYHEDGTPAPFTALSGEPDENAIDGKGGADKVTTGAEEILTSEGGLNGFTEVQVAVAPPGSANGTAGDIYVTDAENGRIVVFAPSGEYLGVKAISSYPCGVAVGPTGDVFVGSYEGTNEGVTKLEPSAPATFAQSAASPFGPGETSR